MENEPPNGGQREEIKTVTIRTYGKMDDAEMGAANLEAHGIQWWISTIAELIALDPRAQHIADT